MLCTCGVFCSYYPDWIAVRCSFGMNGILVQDRDVLPFASFLEKHQKRRPPDHLVVRLLLVFFFSKIRNSVYKKQLLGPSLHERKGNRPQTVSVRNRVKFITSMPGFISSHRYTNSVWISHQIHGLFNISTGSYTKISIIPFPISAVVTTGSFVDPLGRDGTAMRSVQRGKWSISPKLSLLWYL